MTASSGRLDLSGALYTTRETCLRNRQYLNDRLQTMFK
jgi:hypothetical protein